MDEDCQTRTPRDELKAMRAFDPRWQGGRQRSACRFVAQPRGSLRPAGRSHPGALWAMRTEIFSARRRVARDGHRQSSSTGGGREAEMKSGLMHGCPKPPAGGQFYKNLVQRRTAPASGSTQRDRVKTKPRRQGSAPIAVLAEPDDARPSTCAFAALPRLADLAPRSLISSDEEKRGWLCNPAIRQKLHEEMIEWKVELPGCTIAKQNGTTRSGCTETVLERTSGVLKEKSIQRSPRPQKQGDHRRVPRSGREEKLRTQRSGGREQREEKRRCGRDRPPPKASDRVVGWRRECNCQMAVSAS